MEGIGSVLVRVPGDQLQGMIAAVSDPPLTAVQPPAHRECASPAIRC